ncbi:type A chloramphenicol O-acetyltransferase [Lysinibacillus fusiformis]|uniref:type A chloramphenicol O-acetyltransferase n=1 Tax=Lysinibacillus fusiformis TaxID=28031 RepID=UPI000468BB5B|nr:type A chloramphenicol O-acetyltransferase [Lysinibacillus fusiformis]
MKFYLIDRENWRRKEYFEHYLQQQTSFSITNEINITVLMENLKQKNLKLYPAFIFMMTKIVNAHQEFRTNFNAEGQLGYWEKMLPSYTIFDKQSCTFSSVWTSDFTTFTEFHTQYEQDIEIYNGTDRMFPKTPIPENNIPISMIPWCSFTGFNLNIHNGGDYLLPIITGGQYASINGEYRLPISLQFHHAVCDGYHASIFMNELQRLADNSAEWL